MGSDKLSETYMRQQTGDDDVLVKKVGVGVTLRDGRFDRRWYMSIGRLMKLDGPNII